MNGTGLDSLPKASPSSRNGAFSRKRMVRSSAAANSSVWAIRVWPNPSRAAQRRMLATQSRASTGAPSWKRSPSRSRMVTVRPLSAVSKPSAICGWVRNAASVANSVS